ncbi:MAG: hypothetical protein KBD51_01410 [Candidatus Levybacteria bacterium]|nr:hypothetical protein [Candidatus Levybacteria bacterium]
MTHEGIDTSGGDALPVWRPSFSRILADLRSDIVSYSRDGLSLSQRTIWSAEDVVEAIRTPEGIQFLESTITSDETVNRYLIGLFLTSVPVGQLSPQARLALGPVQEIEADVKIAPFYRSWDLCAASERYLEEAMERRGTILAGDAILLKEKERKAGLCVQTTSTPAGTFLAGSWYEPIDQEGLEASFRSGERRIGLSGDWVHMRDISAYHTDQITRDVMFSARRHADKIKRLT